MELLKDFFKPNSVAVVGASDKEGKIGNIVLKNIMDYGFEGDVYPVNPGKQEILGLKSYSSLKEIETPPELAIIVVASNAVNLVAKEAVECGVKYLIVITAGFKEVGKEGKEREKEFIQITKETDIKVLGPNCLGIMDTHTPINASFAGDFPSKGNVAFISQSGALLVFILDWSLNVNIGFSRFVSLGNKSDLNEADFILSMAEDDNTSVVLCYLEDVVEGEAFIDAVKKTSKKKPVIILKSGASESGAQAASSHTGAMAGNDMSYDVAFRQSGALRAHSLEELFDLAEAFSKHNLPKGDSVAVITNSGGPAIITTDWIEKEGLKMAKFSKDTTDKLQEGLPSEAGIYNPVDVLGDATYDRFEFAIDTILQDEGVDNLIVLLGPSELARPSKLSQLLVEKQQIYKNKPIFASFMGGDFFVEAERILNEGDIPCYTFPEKAVKAIGAMVSYASYKKKECKDKPLCYSDVKKDIVKANLYDAFKENRRVLLSSEAFSIVDAYGIPAAPIKLARSSKEAVEIAEEMGYPVVLKVASPSIQHKTDFGGIKVGLESAEEVEKGFIDILDRVQKYFPDLALHGVDVQKMAPEGNEVIVGMSKDLIFGPLIAFGLGGIYVNLIEDVSFRLSKGLSDDEIWDMILETKAYKMLRGFRGSSPSDISAVKDVIGRLAVLCEDFTEITEVDLNPVFVYEEGVLAVDVKITVEWDD
ncbi:acetate--CoA ligase alpha subunit [Natranaerofaba carboxydovora]|uniref:acetate--CoA ligase alpha subunit n=1 Tax=Natranaerofaba carboxydovora TaxID=2742683 RepID=UPI001F140612|nr:acetate--CoA ligase [Natranaerofaba carboxydovora]UMZ74325.1 ATP-grasp domain protein [Natranaerofaba carboxydovora]